MSKTKHCLNCGHVLHDAYCPHCGQSGDTGKISWKSFGYDLIETITHAHRSIAGTSWQLIRHPGLVLKEYVAGKRKKYQSPVSFFIVWVTLSILIHRFIIARSGFHPVFLKGLTFNSAESIQSFIHHGEWFYILSFPLSALILYILLAHKVYSFIETMVITMYGFAMSQMFFVVIYLIGGGLLSLNVLHWKFYLFQIILSLGLATWICCDVFWHYKIRFFWWRIVLYNVINSVVVLKFLEFLSNCWSHWVDGLAY